MKVLFATDGAAPSDHAAALIERLVDRGRARVHVICVNGFETALREAQSAGHYSPEGGQAFAESTVEDAVLRLRGAGFDTDGEAPEGDEATEIVAAIDRVGADVVALGTAKERWIDTVVLGSVSGSVVHAASCPVLVVHAAPTHDRPLRVVVGTDGSEGSRRALEAFVGTADPERCEAIVVSVAKPVALPPGGPAGVPTFEATVGERDLASTRQVADDATESLRAAGFRATTIVTSGNPARVLLDEVDRAEADLVVVGARGLGSFRAKVLGSVSDKVLRHARATLVGR